MRPPSASIFLFAAAAAFLIYGAFAVRRPAPTAPYAPTAETSMLTADLATSAPTGPDLAWRFNALDPGVSEAAGPASIFDPSDDYWGMPREDGVDLVAGYCIACHSMRIVMQQRASETRWRELMDWMVEKQGMAQPPDDDLEVIVQYLSKHFGA